jgi:hypothetical protein
VQGTTNATNQLVLSSAIDGGAYTAAFTFSSTGSLTGPPAATFTLAAQAAQALQLNAPAVSTTGGPQVTGGSVLGRNANMSWYGPVNGQLGFGPTTDNVGTNDAFFTRDTVAVIQLGADAATAIPQTLKAHDGQGTDRAGADLILTSGNPTGAGIQGDIKLKTAYPGVTSATQQTPTERLVIAAAKPLTDAPTPLFEIALPAGAMTGGSIDWTIEASDGTDHQAYASRTTFASINKAGVYTSTITHNTANDSKVVSAGTLTAAWSIVPGTNKITVSVTPACSLAKTTYRMSYIVKQNAPRALTRL